MEEWDTVVAADRLAMTSTKNGMSVTNRAMSTATETIEGLVKKEYKYGFYTDVEADANHGGSISVRELSGYLKKKVSGWASRFRGVGQQRRRFFGARR